MAIFNEHLKLSKQNQIDDIKWLDNLLYEESIKYCILFHCDLPVARGAIEPYSDNAWEAADIRSADEYRGKGFAKEILSFLSKYIIENGRIATCRTEDDNHAMLNVIKSLGYVVVDDV